MDQRLIQESKRPSFNKLKCSPANLEQLESCYERDRSIWFYYPGIGTVKIHLLLQSTFIGEFLSHGGKRKSIVVIVSPPEALVLDVPEAFTATDTSHANFVSQHHSSWVPCYWLFKLPAKSSSGALQGTVKRSLHY